MGKILCAAVWFHDGKTHVHQPKNVNNGFVIAGRRHHNCYYTLAACKHKDANRMDFGKQTQGFLTDTDRFVSREEAGRIAFEAGQTETLKTLLFSEDLY